MERAASDGERFKLIKTEMCEPVPAPGSYRRASDRRPVDPPMPWDFPIVAECLECRATISRKNPVFSDWHHGE